MSDIHPERAAFVNPTDCAAYLDTLFGAVEWLDDDYIVVRGVVEDGEEHEGRWHSEELAIRPAEGGWQQKILEKVRRWSMNGYSSFICPAVLKDKKATAANVRLFTSVMCDFDLGDPGAKLAKMEAEQGAATIVVESGGAIDGKPKLHAYWVFDEPCEHLDEVMQARYAFGKFSGGDKAFTAPGARHQNIRIPGSCHHKAGAAACSLRTSEGPTYSFADISFTAESLPIEKEEKKRGFNSKSGIGKPSVEDLMETKVHAGGVDDMNRWQAFSSIAGSEIRRCVRGRVDLEHGKFAVYGWMHKNMVPPWPDEKFDYQWDTLVRKALEGEEPPQEEAKPEQEAEPKASVTWQDCLIDPFDPTPPPAPIYSLAGEPICTPGNISVMSAHVKAGKSSAVAAMVASSFGRNEVDTFSFESVNPDGKAVVYADTEQSKYHARKLMNSTMRRIGITASTLPRWFVPIGLRGHSHKNMQRILGDAIRYHHETLGIHSFFIDGVADLVRDVNDAEECDDLISALEAMVAECDTTVMGVIHMNPNSDKERGHLGSELQRKAETILKIQKENGVSAIYTPIARGAEIPKARGPRFCWSNDAGMHVSCTKSGKIIENLDTGDMSLPEKLSWLVMSIGHAAKAGKPFAHGGKNHSFGFYKRRHELHPKFREQRVSYDDFAYMVEKLLEEKTVVTCTVKKVGTALDVPEGEFATEIATDIVSGAYEPPEWSHFEFCKSGQYILDLNNQDNPKSKQLGFRSGL